MGEDAVPFLMDSVEMHSSISSADQLRQCRDDPSCKWVWTTSSLLAGAEVEITGVIGSYNTSVGGTRCHVTSQETDVTCHRLDSTSKYSRGEAFLLEGVPTAFPNQTALPIAAMCHYHFQAVQNEDLSKWDRWCHLISGKEFIVVPKDGIAAIGMIDSSYPESMVGSLMEGLQLEHSEPKSLRGSGLRVVLTASDAFQTGNLGNGETAVVGYPRTCR